MWDIKTDDFQLPLESGQTPRQMLPNLSYQKDLFGGGTQKTKTTTTLPPNITALQTLLTRLLLARLYQGGGTPQLFSGWKAEGPRPMPGIMPTSSERKNLGLPGGALGGPPVNDPNLNPLVAALLRGGL